MNLFQEALEKRFGATSIKVHSTSNISFSIVTVQSVERKGVTFLMTNGLSAYEQPATEKNKAHNHIELVFCL